MMSHAFDEDDAEKYGLSAAVILYGIKYWTAHSRANNVHFYDGRYWTFNSIKAFEELYPYLGKHVIRHALEKLEKDGAIVSGNYNKSAYDRTKWYSPNCEIHLGKNPNGIESDPNSEKIINTVINTLLKENVEKKVEDVQTSSAVIKDDLPHQRIIDLYHEILPMCPRIKDWTPNRARKLKSRIRESTARKDISFWQKLFEYIATSDFLTGRLPPRDGRKPFVASLEWIITAENFAKIRENRYANK